MSRIKIIEPKISPENYVSDLSHAFNWYNQEKDKKDARSYLKDYITLNYTKHDVKTFDRLPESKIIITYGWLARMVINGSLELKDQDQVKLSRYLESILDTSDVEEQEEVVEEVKVLRPTVRDNMKEKVGEYLGELEGAIDDFFIIGKELNLYTDLKSRTIPQPYCPFIAEWIKKVASEYITVENLAALC